MPDRLFVFIQLEFPWALGPADGRYLLRAGPEADAEHVVVLGTLGAPRLPIPAARPPRWRSRREPEASPEPAPVTTTRATVIDPVPLSAESQARAWLADLDREHEIASATAVLNRVLHLHRLSAADPYVHEVSPAQALVIRAGWGVGEQVADGTWLHARELDATPRTGRRRSRRDRSAALRPQERLAMLLGGRVGSLMCEEHVLRARLDLDAGRLAHAAVELDAAYALALPELHGERRHDLSVRLAELEKLQPQVRELARGALAAVSASAGEQPAPPDEEALAHLLGRLEAALRARTAAGFNLA
ncbi:MAG TPA: hypothetical protein VFW29_00420 [Solirubrobacteraceae bacterium]|nr:hypothetical protein [Solirubrobacteraceae bacterium]